MNKTRVELVDYFREKYKSNQFVKHDFESMGDDLLIKAYEQDMFIKKEEENIFANGLITYRISYDTKETEKELTDYMKNNNMYTYDEDGLKLNVRIGNYCVVHVPEYFLDELKNKFADKITYTDLKTNWIGEKDLQCLQVGDKVQVSLNGIFGSTMDQGTVHAIDNECVTIRKYRSKTKGYVMNAGEQGSIEKIEKFSKSK